MALRASPWWRYGVVRSHLPLSAACALLVAALAATPREATARPQPPPTRRAEGRPAHGAGASKAASPGASTRGRPTAKLGAALASRVGKSIGSPTDGHLLGAARLADAPYLRILPTYAGDDVRYGLSQLVGMVDRSARAVARRYPGSVLSVGHLSRPGGGPVDHHHSHASGRDVDIAFYAVGPGNKPVHADAMVTFRADGAAATWPGARFDDARNWALVHALLTDPRARISHIFVARPIRARLLAHAAKVGAPPDVRSLASRLMVQPRGALPHDDHFHVRISCPAGMQACVETPRRRAMAKATPAPRHAPASAPREAPALSANPAAPAAPAERTAPPPEPQASATAPRRAPAGDDDDLDGVPSLASPVPGLDSVVIPRRLDVADDVDGPAGSP